MISWLALCLLSAQPAHLRAAVINPIEGVSVDGDLTDWPMGLSNGTTVFDVTAGHTMETTAGHTLEPTIGWAAYDDDHLYFAFRATDDDIQGSHRGGEIWRDDLIEITWQNTDRQWRHLGVSSSGHWHEFGGHKVRGVRSAATKHKEGFVIEVAIPLKVLSKTKAGGTEPIAINFMRKDVDQGGKQITRTLWSGYRPLSQRSAGKLFVSPKTKRTLPTDAAAETPFECRHWASPVVVSQPLSAQGDQLVSNESEVALRIVNFQLAEESWTRFWTEWSPAKVAHGLDAAHRLGANTIRIFVFFELFGGRHPTKLMRTRLRQTIELARQRGILSIVSFFPFKKEFQKTWWPAMSQHVVTIAEEYRGDPAIAMWDLMNEPDHAWGLPHKTSTAKDVDAWAHHLLGQLRRADPTHLTTLGLAGHFTKRKTARASEVVAAVDVISIHGYVDDQRMVEHLSRAKSATAKPLVLQELGRTRLFFDDNETAHYYEETCAVTRRLGYSGVGAWELFDHPVGSIAHHGPWNNEHVENYFGLIDEKGRTLPAAKAFCQCLKATKLVVKAPKP